MAVVVPRGSSGAAALGAARRGGEKLAEKRIFLAGRQRRRRRRRRQRGRRGGGGKKGRQVEVEVSSFSERPRNWDLDLSESRLLSEPFPLLFLTTRQIVEIGTGF